MRYLVNEVDAEGFGEAGGAGEAGAEDAALVADGGTPSPAESAAPAWQDTPEFHDAVAEASQAQWEAWQAQQQQAQEPGDVRAFDPDEFDPTDPQQFLGILTERDKFMLNQMQELVAPLRQQAELVENQRRDALMADVLADVQARNGIELPPKMQRDATRDASEEFDAQVSRNPGLASNARIAEAIIERHVKEYGAELHASNEAYYQRKMNELAAATGAPRSLQSGTDGVETRADYETVEEASNAFLARQLTV